MNAFRSLRTRRAPAAAAPALYLQLLFGFHAAPLFAKPGDLDPTFWEAGVSRIGFLNSSSRGEGVAMQADGKIVVAGWSQNGGDNIRDFSVSRYNPDGSLDTSFGNQGLALTSFGWGYVAHPEGWSFDLAFDVAIQADGKIVAGGESNGRFALARYNPDGTLDTSFGGDGKVTTGAEEAFRARALAIQADGKIVLAGIAKVSASSFGIGVARYNTDGSLDLSFGTQGIVTTTMGGEGQDANAVAIQPDGKIVVAGVYYPGGFAVLARYNTNGFPDTSFDSDGVVLTTGIQDPRALGFHISPLGPLKIVIAGTTHSASTNDDFTLARYNSNGSLDVGWGTNGILVRSLGSTNDAPRSLVMLCSGCPSNRILVTGRCEDASHNSRFAAMRLFPDGAFDTSFDGDGVVITPVSTGTAESRAIALDNGKVVLAGDMNSQTVIVRYNNDGSLDTSFDGDGIRIDKTGSPDATGKAIAIQSDGKIVVVGSSGPSSRDFAVARLNAQGYFDPSFGGGDGRVTTPIGTGDDRANAVAIQPDGKIVVAGYAQGATDVDFAVARYNSDGTLDTSFSADGKTTVSQAADDFATAVLVMPNGKLLLVGYTIGPASYDVMMVRLSAEGTIEFTATLYAGGIATAAALQPDGKLLVVGFSFGGPHNEFITILADTEGSIEGIYTTSIGNSVDRAYALAIQSDGKFVVAGSSQNGTRPDMALVRYNPDHSLDSSFDGDGKVTTSVGPSDAIAYAVAIQPNGKILVAGSSADPPVTDYAFVRYNPDGSLDPSFGVGGKITVDVDGNSPDVAYGLALDSSGRAVAVGDAGTLFGVIRVLGDNWPSDTAGDMTSLAGFRLGVPWPNPTHDSASVTFHLAARADVEMTIVDVAGRRVRKVAAERRYEAGSCTLRWDGRDDAGVPVASGVYLVRARNGNRSEVRRLAVVR